MKTSEGAFCLEEEEEQGTQGVAESLGSLRSDLRAVI